MLILKFGGTSVGSPTRMRALVDLIQLNEPRIVVLSAVSGTTNTLVKIAESLYAGDKAKASNIIKGLEESYHTFINELYTTPEGKQKATAFIDAHFDYLRSFIADVFTSHEEKAILGQGELISTGLFHFYLHEIGVNSVLLPALDFMRTDEEGEPLLSYISSNLSQQIAQHPDKQLFITQGYICRNAFGEIDNLKRGGSDYSASLIGAAIQAREIQIWTDIDGMHNNDPRIVPNTRPVAELSFDEAAELAYFGAKILHPSSVLPAQKYNIPVRLLNTMQPHMPGTLITQQSSKGSIKALAAKDGIVAIKIKSGRMLMAYGFLRNVFEIFERYKTPIDMITTSEVAVSLTIDNATHLSNIVEELSVLGSVEVDHNQAIICVVGDFLADSEGYALSVFKSLRNVPIRMISYGGSKNNISFLVSDEHKNASLLALHEGLFSQS